MSRTMKFHEKSILSWSLSVFCGSWRGQRTVKKPKELHKKIAGLEKRVCGAFLSHFFYTFKAQNPVKYCVLPVLVFERKQREMLPKPCITCLKGLVQKTLQIQWFWLQHAQNLVNRVSEICNNCKN